MKHLKHFESTSNPIKQLKKYVLLDVKNKNGSLSIYEIKMDTDNKWMEVNKQIMFIAYRLYKIDTKEIKEITYINKEGNGINFRLSFILEHLIAHSNNIQDLLEIAKLYVQKSKFNL